MSHRFGRACSLALAVLFLLLSGAIAFAAMFSGVTVFADDTATPAANTTITPNVTGITATVGGEEKNLKRTALNNNDVISKLVLKMSQPLDVATDPKNGNVSKFEFNNDLFSFAPSTVSTPILAITSNPGGTMVNYTITITDEITYRDIDSDKSNFSYTYTVDGSNQVVCNATAEVYSAQTDGGISMMFAEFWNSNTPVSKVTRGNYAKFEVTVRDSGMTYLELEDMVRNQSLDVKINSDFLNRYSQPTVTNISSWSGGVEYTLSFSGVNYTGTTDIMLMTISYPDDRYPTRRIKEQISGCEIYERNSSKDDDDDDSSSSRPDIAPPTPNIIVSKFDYGGKNVQAANPFTLRVILTNTSQKLPIDNIVMKVTVPEAFTMNSSSNTFYINNMTKNSSVEHSIELAVKPNAEPISHAIKLSFTFEAVIDETRKQFTSEQEISVPVSQLDRFSLEQVEVPQEIYVGEDAGFSATFINKGKTTIYNVSAEIAGNISQPGQRQFIGNIESGKEESADFLLGALADGPITGEVIITYEDANMRQGELRSPFSTNGIVMNMGPDMDAMNPADMLPEEPLVTAWYAKIPVWGYLVAGAVIIILFAFAAKIVRNRREQKLLEDDDEDI